MNEREEAVTRVMVPLPVSSAPCCLGPGDLRNLAFYAPHEKRPPTEVVAALLWSFESPDLRTPGAG